MSYIRRTLSCCICRVFHSVFSVYVYLMYIFLSLYFVDGFYCAILLDIVLFCCCTPDNDVISPSPDMGRYNLCLVVFWFVFYCYGRSFLGVFRCGLFLL